MAKRKKDIIQWPRAKRTENTMAKRKKGQIIQWPREKRTEAIVLSVLFSLGHCIICPFFSWPLYYVLMAKRKKDIIQWSREKRT
jgi:hypothetical protein